MPGSDRVFTRGKGSEIGASRALPATLMLKGGLVTFDAMGGPTDVARKIPDHSAGYRVSWSASIGLNAITLKENSSHYSVLTVCASRSASASWKTDMA